MSEKEKKKIIEDQLPDVLSILEEYQKKGMEITREEAERIREAMRTEMESGHVYARDDYVGEDMLERIAGGTGGAPMPTFCIDKKLGGSSASGQGAAGEKKKFFTQQDAEPFGPRFGV